LIRETWRDKQDAHSEDLHKNDTVQEKLSLAARFGVQIGYFKPTPKEFQAIVEGLAERNPELQISQEELLKQANAWEMQHGGLSGRTAQQFIDHLLGLKK
jgi:predicted AAA+ superfamily ATPase